MKQQILAIERLKGESAVLNFIVKSMRDLKQAEYTRGEIINTMIGLTPDHYHSYIKTCSY